MQAMTFTDTSATRLRLVAAVLSLGAGAIHGIVTPEHFEEWWGYGLFFLISAIAQAVYGGLLLRPAWWGERPEAARAFYALGIASNVAIVVLYLVTRTVGVPAGPGAGEVEAITLVSLVSKGLEVALIGCLAVLLRRGRGAPRP